MAIHDAGMFTVKEINRLKILHDVIDRGPGLLNLALTKGGKFYVITAAREHGPNFEATAEVYK